MIPRTQPFARRAIDAVAGLLGLGLLTLCGLVVHDGSVGGPERHVFVAINHLPDALSPVMQGVQFLGVLAIAPVLALGALILRRWRLALAIVVVALGKLLAERAVWEVVQRDRPGTTEPGAIVRAGTPTTGVSFVSGHVVLTTALAWVLTPYLRGRWRMVPWAVVGLVGSARIYLGAHNPLDVLGGLGLGLAVGATTNLLVGTPTKRTDAAPGQPISTGAPTSDPYSVQEPS